MKQGTQIATGWIAVADFLGDAAAVANAVEAQNEQIGGADDNELVLIVVSADEGERAREVCAAALGAALDEPD